MNGGSESTYTGGWANLGGYLNLGVGFGGYTALDVGELLVYDKYLSDTELSSVVNAANSKWNVF